MDARSACVAALDHTGDEGAAAAAVTAYFRLGAPVVLVCGSTLQRWRQRADGHPERAETIEPERLPKYFEQNRDNLGPTDIYRWKTLGRVRPEPAQLDFVDAGLLPAVEHEVGARLTRHVEAVITELAGAFDAPPEGLEKSDRTWILEGTFYLLAAKLLRDKDVGDFRGLQLEDVDKVFQLVNRHYGARVPALVGNARQRRALVRGAERFDRFRYLGHVTTDILADVYEGALVDPLTRKALGTHSTPSFMVDYLVWQLLPWVEQIPLEDRHVFEPACGHSPFLSGAMRLLRFLLPDGYTRTQSHDYLKAHLHGVDADDRALEVARLSLTMADVPNPNGWDLDHADMFDPDVLRSRATKARVLLCNPPFEEFKPEERARYKARGAEVLYALKPMEMLRRTLPHLPAGAVFALVLPQTVLQSNAANAVKLRERIVRDFQVSEVCLLSDKFFRYAQPETALIIGRKQRPRPSAAVHCRKVREPEAQLFRESYGASTDFRHPQAAIAADPHHSLWVPDLPGVWAALQSLPQLRSIANVARGFNFEKASRLPRGTFTYDTRRPTAVPGQLLRRGFAEATTAVPTPIHRCPRLYWMNLSNRAVGVPRGGVNVAPQVVATYGRVGRKAWRIKAFIDRAGHPFRSPFLAVRPKPGQDVPLEYLWALLNSPLANAYLYCHTMKRDNQLGLIETMPVPQASAQDVKAVAAIVTAYCEEASKPQRPARVEQRALFSRPRGPVRWMNPDVARRLLLELDARLLQLYALPPDLERAMLDLFAGVERPGLPNGVSIDRYYPDGFEQEIPLWFLLSLDRFHDLADRQLMGALSASEARELTMLEAAMDAADQWERTDAVSRKRELRRRQDATLADLEALAELTRERIKAGGPGSAGDE